MKLLRLFLLALFFYGCNKQKLQAPDAFFIKPQTISVNSSTIQGTANHKITDLWYYVNNQFKGAFPSTSILPIQSSGNTSVRIYAGIKNNGISATRVPYEFYEPILIDTSLAKGTTLNENLVFNYKGNTVFHWVEGFEGFGTTSGITVLKSNNSDTTFTILNKAVDPNADVFEGSRCFYFALDNNRTHGAFQSAATFSLPKAGAPVYLELNYKCTQPFDIGVYNGSTYTYVSSVNTSENWNKIYIHLTAGVSTNNASTVGWYISAIKQTDNPQFYIDNIKILSY